jgi:hypothetical protein
MNQQYIGMSVQEATVKAQQAGFKVEIEVVGPQFLDCQYRQDRITFKVENGIVTTANVG